MEFGDSGENVSKDNWFSYKLLNLGPFLPRALESESVWSYFCELAGGELVKLVTLFSYIAWRGSFPPKWL